MIYKHGLGLPPQCSACSWSHETYGFLLLRRMAVDSSARWMVRACGGAWRWSRGLLQTVYEVQLQPHPAGVTRTSAGCTAVTVAQGWQMSECWTPPQPEHLFIPLRRFFHGSSVQSHQARGWWTHGNGNTPSSDIAPNGPVERSSAGVTKLCLKRASVAGVCRCWVPSPPAPTAGSEPCQLNFGPCRAIH